MDQKHKLDLRNLGSIWNKVLCGCNLSEQAEETDFPKEVTPVSGLSDAFEEPQTFQCFKATNTSAGLAL